MFHRFYFLPISVFCFVFFRFFRMCYTGSGCSGAGSVQEINEKGGGGEKCKYDASCFM